MRLPIGRKLTRLGALAAHPAVFAVLTVYAVPWFIFDRQSSNWQGVAAIATLMMTLFITRTEHRERSSWTSCYVRRAAQCSFSALDGPEPGQGGRVVPPRG